MCFQGFKDEFMGYGRIFGMRIKLFYNVKGLTRMIFPKGWYRSRLTGILNDSQFRQDVELQLRVAYYNKLNEAGYSVPETKPLCDFSLKGKASAYFFDTYEYSRYFPDHLKAHFLFGDITFVPPNPSIVKSRPIGQGNEASILLNLDKYRHFNFISDRIPFSKKMAALVWRGHVSSLKPERLQFLEKYYEHPLCDVGNTNQWAPQPEWQKPFMSIKDQLRYKYILCLEGVDVATNLKWVMSSNSVAVMPRPRYETWFMEGTLRPGCHYVEIKDDFSDLEAKLRYYNQHPKEAETIIANAHAYVKQFQNSARERYVSLKVLEKYFLMTGQVI